jgi:hypothetical protein
MSAEDRKSQTAEASAGAEASGLITMLQGLIEAARAMVASSRAFLTQLDRPPKPPLH